MANIARRWRKVLAVGCSHGCYADPLAVEAVHKFRAAFRPDTVIHLGDWADATAFMGRAMKGDTPAHGAPIRPDISDGLEFLKAVRANIVFCGNHEARLYRLRESQSAIVAECAKTIIECIEATCKRLKAELVPYDVLNGWREVGGFRYAHGYWYNELALRDCAESVGNSVTAHSHAAGMARGRRLDNPIAYGTGCLCEIARMEYALTRRATMRWSQGFVWGEYTANQSQLWLHDNGRNSERKPWRLPKV
jgi:hypothetical protein